MGQGGWCLFILHGKRARPATREKRSHLVRKKSSTSKHHLQSSLKSFNAAEAAWSWSLENYDSFKNSKKIIFLNGWVSLYKKSNLIIFLLLASRENTSWKVFIWLFWNSKGLVTTEIRFLVKKKKRNRDLKIKVNFSFWTLLTFL